MEIRALVGKVDKLDQKMGSLYKKMGSLDKKMGTLVDLFTESLKLQKE